MLASRNVTGVWETTSGFTVFTNFFFTLMLSVAALVEHMVFALFLEATLQALVCMFVSPLLGAHSWFTAHGFRRSIQADRA